MSSCFEEDYACQKVSNQRTALIVSIQVGLLLLAIFVAFVGYFVHKRTKTKSLRGRNLKTVNSIMKLKRMKLSRETTLLLMELGKNYCEEERTGFEFSSDSSFDRQSFWHRVPKKTSGTQYSEQDEEDAEIPLPPTMLGVGQLGDSQENTIDNMNTNNVQAVYRLQS